jgi:hypothetical protein
MLAPTVESGRRNPWNKGKLVGQKAPLKLKEISAIRVRLELGDRKRQLALFNLAIDSKLRGCDLVQLCVRDVAHGDRIAARAIVMQQKTQRPVQFEITEPTRKSVSTWIRHAVLMTNDFLFPSRLRLSPHLSTRQYARIVESWVAGKRRMPFPEAATRPCRARAEVHRPRSTRRSRASASRKPNQIFCFASAPRAVDAGRSRRAEQRRVRSSRSHCHSPYFCIAGSADIRAVVESRQR